MQEELEHKSVALSIQTTKVTSRVLAKAMVAALHQMQKSRDKPGRTSIKNLAKGGSISNIDVKDGNIKDFDPIARKYGIKYALQKDMTAEPPRWMVFFRAKDVDAMTAAFKEFSAKTLKKEADKPSTVEAMREAQEVSRNAIRVRVRGRSRGGPEL